MVVAAPSTGPANSTMASLLSSRSNVDTDSEGGAQNVTADGLLHLAEVFEDWLRKSA